MKTSTCLYCDKTFEPEEDHPNGLTSVCIFCMDERKIHCDKCKAKKPLREYRQWGRGIRYTCRDCLGEINRKTQTDNIKECKVANEYLISNRLMVYLVPSYLGKKTMAKARYAWLMANLAFKFVPKGYEVHHLDCDPLNNDPTNLVLFQKYLHIAYHLKIKPTEVVPVELFDRSEEIYNPTKKPVITKTISEKKGSVLYNLRFYDPSRGKTIKMSKLGGIKFRTGKEAEDMADLIWRGSEYYYPE